MVISPLSCQWYGIDIDVFGCGAFLHIKRQWLLTVQHVQYQDILSIYSPKGDRTFQYRCMQPFNSDKGTTCRLSQGMSTWSKLIKTLQPGDIQLSICLSTIYSTYKFVCLHLYFFPMAYRVCDAAKLHLICGHTGITSYNNHVRHYLLPGSFHKLPWSALQSHRCRQRWR